MRADGTNTRELAEAWIRLHCLPPKSNERELLFWAFECLNVEPVEHDPELAWEAIDAIRKRDGSDIVLANLAAGPLEDLLARHGDQFIARCEALSRADAQFRKILGAVWRNSMSDAV